MSDLYSLSSGTRVIKMVFFFALSFPRRELQHIISTHHQINTLQNKNFPRIQPWKKQIITSFCEARESPNPKICLWTQANLNNIDVLCMTPNQPKPPFLQGKGTVNFWSFQVVRIGFRPFVRLVTGCQLEMIDLHCRVGIRCL